MILPQNGKWKINKSTATDVDQKKPCDPKNAKKVLAIINSKMIKVVMIQVFTFAKLARLSTDV